MFRIYTLLRYEISIQNVLNLYLVKMGDLNGAGIQANCLPVNLNWDCPGGHHPCLPDASIFFLFSFFIFHFFTISYCF